MLSCLPSVVRKYSRRGGGTGITLEIERISKETLNAVLRVEGGGRWKHTVMAKVTVAVSLSLLK
jgi:hypothetical protein